MAASRFRSVALLAAASLSLAACGGGGGSSTTTTPTPPADTTAKEGELAQKEKELNNRPPRVVTRTVAGPTRTVTVQAPLTGSTHVGFSGSDFSSDEVNGLAHKVIDIQDYPLISFVDSQGHSQTQETAKSSNTKINGESYVEPKLTSSVSQGRISYTFSTYRNAVDYSFGAISVDEVDPDITNSKIFELTELTDITGLDLDEQFIIKLFKEEVDTNNDNTKEPLENWVKGRDRREYGEICSC